MTSSSDSTHDRTVRDPTEASALKPEAAPLVEVPEAPLEAVVDAFKQLKTSQPTGRASIQSNHTVVLEKRASLKFAIQAAKLSGTSVGEGVERRDQEARVSVIAKRVFDDVPNLHTPRVKKRRFATSHLNKESGFILKYFKYLRQIYRRWSDDTYAGLRSAVTRFNGEKTDANLAEVIKHIQLIKSDQGSEYNDDTLARIASETVIAKIQMMAVEPQVTISKKIARNIGKANIPDHEVQKKIGDYNAEKNALNAHGLMVALFEWMKTKPEEMATCSHEVLRVIYELGSAVKEPQLGELFGILKTEKTLIAHKKIGELEKATKENVQEAFSIDGVVLDIPQVNLWFARFRGQEVQAAREAIKTFNQEKNPKNFQNVLNALKQWQYVHNNQFNGSNGFKILSEMHEILKGTSIQDRIKKTDGYEFYRVFRGIQKKIPEPSSKWNTARWDFAKWFPLPVPTPSKRGQVPSPEMQAVAEAVKQFNKDKKLENRGEVLSHLFKVNRAWIQAQPKEFMRCGGDKLLKRLQKNILTSVTTISLQNLDFKKSTQFETLRQAIITYNHERSLIALQQVKTALELWRTSQPNRALPKGGVALGEFHRLQGADFEAHIDTLLQAAEKAQDADKSMTMPSILLPSSHPTKVFEKSLALKEEADVGQNAYLMIFHNPIAPWSHSDIGFVTGAEPITPKKFVAPVVPPPDLSAYFQNGQIEHIDPHDFPDKHRVFLNDAERYVLGPNRALLDPRTKEVFANCQGKGFTGDDVHAFLKDCGFIDDEDNVLPKYYTEGRDDELFKPKFEEALPLIRLLMPDPIVPSLLTKQIDIAKSEEAFEFLKKKGYLDENDMVKKDLLYKNSPLFKDIEKLFVGDDEFIGFLREVLSTPISRVFTPESFQQGSFGEKESQQLYQYIKDKGLLIEKRNSRGEEVVFLKPSWQEVLKESDPTKVMDDLPEELKPYREKVIHYLQMCPVSGEVSKREYLGIGADPKGLDTSSKHAEGVRITDPRLVSRLQKLCKRRKNEIQRNMNVLAGAKGGARGLVKGGYASLLVSEEDKVRHLRQALIDNFLTTKDPQSFLPNLKEPRYRLELYESGGEIYKKWVEDPLGQFSKMKNPSSQDVSGEHVENEYRHNSYALVDGKLKSVKTMDKERLEGNEKGNIIYKADGTQMWQADSEFGQYFKPRGAPAEEAVRDERPLYSAMNCERYLSNGESEWCGSCVIRLLHSAYIHEYMPEFETILKGLDEDFTAATGFEKDSHFEKRHAGMLFSLAELYAKKLLKTEATQKYFRDMNPTIRLSPRCTPDMIHEFLMGKSPGVVNSMQRAWKTVQMPDSRGQVVEGTSMKVSVGAAETGLGVLAIPTATLKLVANVASAVTGTVIDTLVTAPQQAAQRKAEELSRKQEAQGSKPIKFKAAKIARAALGGFIKGGLIKRVGGDLLGVSDLVDSVKSVAKLKERSAFA